MCGPRGASLFEGASKPANPAFVNSHVRPAEPESISKEKTATDLYQALNAVQHPSMIRVEADEVSYILHIILRYELESGLIDGTITTEQLPQLWNEKMEEYLGISPSNAAEGVLQDVHWGAGLFGYFPTYSLGAMYAQQIYATAELALPTLQQDIAQGEFTPLKQWLNLEVHQVGSMPVHGDELMVAVTGQPLQPKGFVKYLEDKYSQLYQL